MIVEILDGTGQPLRVPASRVVVRDSATNTPIAVVAELGGRGFMAATASDKDFQKVLRTTGVLDSVLVTELTKEQIAVPGVF